MVIAFIGCLLGTQGIEQIAIPTICSIVFIIFTSNRNYINIRDAVKVIISILFVSILGLGIYSEFLTEKIGIIGLTKIFQIKDIEDIKNLGNLFFSSINVWLCDNSFNKNSIISIVCFVTRAIGSACLIFIMPILYIIKKDTENVYKKFFVCFAYIQFLEILMIFLISKSFSAGHHVRYFANSFLLLSSIGCAFLYDKIKYSKKTHLTLIIIGLFLLVILNGSTMMISYEKYKNEFAAKRAIVSLLAHNNLQYGYSSYWNAAINTALSNGDIQINNLHLNGRTIEPYMLFTSRKWYLPQNYEGETFLLLTEMEYENEYWQRFAFSICGNPKRIIKENNIYILVYNYNIARVMPDADKAMY